jgi:hypothetical protein
VDITRIDLMAGQPDGVLGPIWRNPYRNTGRTRWSALGSGAVPDDMRIGIG